MIINKTLLQAAIAKATEVNDYYRLNHITGDAPQKYMDYVLDSCKALGVGTVQILQVDIPFDQTAVYSMVVMKGSNPDIVLARDLNHCWVRYTVCKEIFHLLIDGEQYRNLDIAAHTEAVTIAYPLNEAKPDMAVAAEFLSEIAAMEFLFPYAKREHLLTLAGQPNFLAIAQQYRIPQLLIDRYLSQHFMEALGDVSPRYVA